VTCRISSVMGAIVVNSGLQLAHESSVPPQVSDRLDLAT